MELGEKALDARVRSSPENRVGAISVQSGGETRAERIGRSRGHTNNGEHALAETPKSVPASVPSYIRVRDDEERAVAGSRNQWLPVQGPKHASINVNVAIGVTTTTTTTKSASTTASTDLMPPTQPTSISATTVAKFVPPLPLPAPWVKVHANLLHPVFVMLQTVWFSLWLFN